MSGTTNVNILPEQALQVRGAVQRTRFWVRTSAVCVFLCGSVAGVSASLARPADALELREQIETMKASSAELRSTIAAHEAALKPVNTELLTQQEVSARPRWHYLVNRVAALAVGRVMLRDLSIRQDPDRETAVYVLHISGVSPSSRDAAEFMVDVQDLGVFSSVQPVSTTAVVIRGAELTRFESSAVLGDPAQASTGPKVSPEEEGS